MKGIETVHYSGMFWERMLSGKDPEKADLSHSLPDEELRTYCDLYLRRGSRVLDLGCGGGRNAHHMAAGGYCVYGVDVSPAAVSFCLRRLARFGLEGVFIQGEMSSLPFHDGFFGGVICAAALDHVTLKAAVMALSEMRRAKESSARIYITFDPPDRKERIRGDARRQSDGSFYYHRGAQKGMLFRSYEDREIEDLIGRQNIVSFEHSRDGDRVIVCV